MCHKLIRALLLGLALISVSANRRRRAAFELPAGAEKITGGPVDTSFECPFDGFFADIKNDCKLFHRCLTQHNAGGRTSQLHETFLCGNRTVWDQSAFACKHQEDAIPCEASEQFFELNERLGKDGPFLGQQDVERARHARPDFKA